MDLNYIYHRQQVSRFRAENAACERSRLVHECLAIAYGDMIASARLDARAGLRA